ncbi:MAG TPA: ATP-dependent helicase C-terminal domain-containing protein [Candidatus Cryosericum sp.]|nr:ATP-dependent helicase C-terminal domain-containing protein [Candidatus Cryosericum sp.]
MRDALPIDGSLEEIRAIVRERRAAIVVAPPGAGKTTRVPPALAADGPLILLQPRRLAARALARRIAVDQGWTLGEEVGWQVRFDRRFSSRTRLLVATEGILTARLQDDPLLLDFRTIVLDEFHERSLHADLALAFAHQAMQARDDLRLVVMSATLDAATLATYLGGCPVVDLPGRLHKVDVAYAPGLAPRDALLQALQRPGGHALCFLPGAPEIRRLEEELRRTLPELRDGDMRAAGRGGARAAGRPPIALLPLHGSLDANAQDKALAPFQGRKLILATNIAETSLTVEGVTDVIDTGLHKVLRYDPATGVDRLGTERIPADSAEQRAGRAGRTGPGRCLRLWDSRDLLRPRREPEIARADLAGPCLEVLAWGADPRRFAWLEPPSEERIEAALTLLEDLGAVREGRLTELGRRLRRLPLHPRLARLLLGTGGSSTGAAACALLSEGSTKAPGRRGPAATTSSDLLQRADHLDEEPFQVRSAASELHALARRLADGIDAGRDDEARFLRATLAAYPDRVARRRDPGSPRLVLASGHGAVLGAESGVREGEFLVAIDAAAGRRGPGSEAVVRMASRIERDWIEPTRRAVEHHIDEGDGAVRALERLFYREMVIAERSIAPDPEVAGPLLAEAYLRRGPDPATEALLRRLRFAGLEADLAGLVGRACVGRTTLKGIDVASHLPPAARRDLDRWAPESIALPSGRPARLHYRDDGAVVASVKLQELFGLAESPRLGRNREPVTFELLAPSGRPVQTTRDLRSFWERTYPEVRKELRGRYPKHPWPEDPWTAKPTHRTTRPKRRG